MEGCCFDELKQNEDVEQHIEYNRTMQVRVEMFVLRKDGAKKSAILLFCPL